MTILAVRFSGSRATLVAATIVLLVAAARFVLTALISSYPLLYSFSPGYVTVTSFVTLAVWAAEAMSAVMAVTSVSRLWRLHHYVRDQLRPLPPPLDAPT